jgi:phosphate transport system substrate-binding protein
MARVTISVSRCRGAVLAELVLVLAAGCGAGAPAGLTAAAAPARVTISETGSTLLFPLVGGTWACEFRQEHPDIVITSAATGSGAGIAGAAAGTADIGASDAYLSAGDLVHNPGCSTCRWSSPPSRSTTTSPACRRARTSG